MSLDTAEAGFLIALALFCIAFAIASERWSHGFRKRLAEEKGIAQALRETGTDGLTLVELSRKTGLDFRLTRQRIMAMQARGLVKMQRKRLRSVPLSVRFVLTDEILAAVDEQLESIGL